MCKCVDSQSSAPNPAGGVYSASPDPLAELGSEGKGEGERGKGGRGGEGGKGSGLNQGLEEIDAPASGTRISVNQLVI